MDRHVTYRLAVNVTCRHDRRATFRSGDTLQVTFEGTAPFDGGSLSQVADRLTRLHRRGDRPDRNAGPRLRAGDVLLFDADGHTYAYRVTADGPDRIVVPPVQPAAVGQDAAAC